MASDVTMTSIVNMTSYMTLTYDVTPITNGSPSYINYKQVLFTYSDIHVIDRVISLCFYVIGLTANPISAYIWLSSKTRANNSSAIYLGVLSITQFIYLGFHILHELRYAWEVNTHAFIPCEILNMSFYTVQYLGPLLVLAFTVERYIAICHPFAKERLCTNRNAVVVIASLLVFCVLVGSVQAYIWTYDAALQYCNNREGVYGTTFLLVWTWLIELLFFGVAPLSALFFNILVVREILKLTSNGPARGGPSSGSGYTSTATLLCVSFYLIITWLPYTITFAMESGFPLGSHELTLEEAGEDEVWRRFVVYWTVRKAMEEFTLSNSACYFFIYYLTGAYFRDKVHQMFCYRFNGCNKKLSSDQYSAVSRSQSGNGNALTRV